MRRLRAWLLRAGSLLHRRRHERDLADELTSHLEMHVEDNLRRGLTPDAARRAALIKLGGVESLKEQYRDQRGVPAFEHIVRDLRYAGRMLRRSPGFTFVSLITIALGVAGPTMTFTMTKAWILDPLPFSRPDELVDLRNLDPVSGNYGGINPADYRDWERGARAFAELAAYRLSDVRITGGDRAERLRGAQATPNFFRLLGVHAASGRVFDAADERGGPARLAVISDRLARERFGAGTGVIGRTVRLDGFEHTIVGVLPADFQFTLLGRVEVWRPLILTPEEAADRRPRSILGLGRLRPGHTVAQAREEVMAVAQQLAKDHPETNARRSARVIGLAEEVRLHHDAGFVVPVLFAMVVCVLLIACVNVTNVMLARTATRRQELAVRLALGASRSAIIRQWLVEHVLLFVTASLVGVLLAVYGVDWVTQSIPPENRQFLRKYAVLTIDGTVLAFAVTMGALCGVIFGLLPAWTGTKSDLNRDLHESTTRTTVGRTGTRVRRVLLVSEVALSLALLIGAGLLVQTARNVARMNVGFDPADLLTFQLSLDAKQYATPDAIRDFYERLVADLARRPGAGSVTAASLVPFGTEGNHRELFIDGQPVTTPAETPVSAVSQVMPQYAETLRLRLKRGRFLYPDGRSESTRTAVINETLASRHFASRDPLGQRLRIGRTSQDLWTVVGVVEDVINFEATDAPEPQVYLPFSQSPRAQMTVVIRTDADSAALVGTVRASVTALDPAEPITDAATMADRMERVTAVFDTVATFVGALGTVTLLLAGVGVYGVVSYTFAQRTREIGIRMALGAHRTDVAALVLKQIRTFLIMGMVPGLVLAWLLGSALQGILIGVTPGDWRLYLTMTLVLSAVALFAAAVPLRRAVAIDPASALRYE